MSDFYYKCNRCGEGFALEDADRNYHDEQYWTACPVCGSEDLDEGEKCKRCGEIEYPWNIQSGVCPECLTECIITFRHKLDELEDDVKEILTDHFGFIDITE